MFDSITNRAEYYSDHYLNARLGADLGDLRAAWDEAEGKDERTARAGLRGAPKVFFPARAAAVEAARGIGTASGRERRIETIRTLNDVVLAALGYTSAPGAGRTTLALPRAGGTDTLAVEAAAVVDTPTGLLLVALDCGLATDVDQLFDATPFDLADEASDAGILLDPLHREGGTKAVFSAADAPGELFSVDEAPRFVLLCAGTVLLLAERSKWAEGRFLAVDLDAALERVDTKARGEIETIAALFSADALVPGHLSGDESAVSVHDQIAEASQKHAVGVSKELREGMRRSVEILANEVIEQRREAGKAIYSGANAVEAKALTTQCLRYLYRLIVLLYAESRPDLGVLPVNDDAYLAGYSVDRLRELLLVDLTDHHARTGQHFQDSLDLLFRLVNDGYHREGAQLTLVDLDQNRTHEEYLEFPGLDATIFDPGSTPLLDTVTLRNETLQQVLKLLMLSPGKRRDDQAGFISYAELGINQLGAVYEGLMAYSGFFATEELVEVAKGGDPSDGTWMVPATDVDSYPAEVFVTRTDPDSGRIDRVTHKRGTFVFRLAGRDRQRSASYYTPEVLTACVVRHALAELLGTDDHARVPGGSAGITRAEEILDLTVCEPALGSGAFLNEAINQLAAEYLRRRQDELGEVLDAERVQRELQKVKAHFALHQCYGVDLNATAVELAEVSLWLNCMHPGLKAPWFGLQLRRGNSLIGCRRATWTTEQLFGKAPNGGVWARDKAAANKPVIPPLDRPLSEPLGLNEVHHFLLPGHGWGVVSGRKEAKELARQEATALGEWRKAILKAPTARDKDRLVALANGVERLWGEAADVLETLHRRMRRPIALYGTDTDAGAPDDDRRTAEEILANPDSALGRLRLVMDAWVGLWFWPLSAELDDLPVRPPGWSEWLDALAAIIGPEPTAPTGQLDFFDDLDALAAVEEARAAERTPVAEVLEQHTWLALAQQLARGEAAWHWELEFAPVFRKGGFDLQVGNPPWVKFSWNEDDFLSEIDARMAVVDLPRDQRLQFRDEILGSSGAARWLLAELASSSATSALMSSKLRNPRLADMQTNLYLGFLDLSYRNSTRRGATGLVHEDSVFFDPNGGNLRRILYRNLRRACLFRNELFLFADLSHTKDYCFTILGGESLPPEFFYGCWMFTPAMFDESLLMQGLKPLRVAIKTPVGDWDSRPSPDRIIFFRGADSDVDQSEDQGGAILNGAPLSKIVLSSELAAIQALRQVADTMGNATRTWSRGIEEDVAKRQHTIVQRTTSPGSPADVILQGPHFSVANPLAKRVLDADGRNITWVSLDLEAIEDTFTPSTGYAFIGQRDEPPQWAVDRFRLVHRKRTNINMERALRVALIPPGPVAVGTCYLGTMATQAQLAVAAGLGAAIPWEYLVRVSGRADITPELTDRWPLPGGIAAALCAGVIVRTLRLNCLTVEYAPLWDELYDPAWAGEGWTAESGSLWGLTLAREPLGAIAPEWTLETPLRRDAERRMALVELDAIAAIMLGLTAEQLCAMYRTQFPVLRKYEYAMAFDAEGRKVCQHHQSAGYRQSQLQQQAKDGERDKRWKNVWQMVLDEEEAPGSVDWEGQFTPPFVRPDREAEMTQAYEVFTERLARSEAITPA